MDYNLYRGARNGFFEDHSRKSFAGKKNALYLQCFSPDGGIGRRTGLKIQRPQGCAGSTPAPGTKQPLDHSILRLYFFLKISI